MMPMILLSLWTLVAERDLSEGSLVCARVTMYWGAAAHAQRRPHSHGGGLPPCVGSAHWSGSRQCASWWELQTYVIVIFFLFKNSIH